MADLSKIKLPNNNEYDLKDAVARSGLASKQDKITVDTITTTTVWNGNDPYTQVVTLGSYTPTANSKVDIQVNAVVIAQLIEDGVKGLYISNSNGTLTMYSIGASPSVALTVQVTITEVN